MVVQVHLIHTQVLRLLMQVVALAVQLLELQVLAALVVVVVLHQTLTAQQEQQIAVAAAVQEIIKAVWIKTVVQAAQV
jgi:hypothetical protein